jgi:hypothetical protein
MDKKKEIRKHKISHQVNHNRITASPAGLPRRLGVELALGTAGLRFCLVLRAQPRLFSNLQ